MKQQRIKILSQQEIKQLYQRPEFNDVERGHFFNLPDELLSTLNIRRKNPRRIRKLLYFILQYGYFQAKHQFFSLSFSKPSSNTKFIMSHFFPNDDFPKTLPSRKSQRKCKDDILDFLNYKDDSKETHERLKLKLSFLLRQTYNPIEIFDESNKFLADERSIVLGYAIMQDLIGAAIQTEKFRLRNELERQLSDNIQQELDHLLNQYNYSYLITTLQCDAKSFETKEMKKEINKQQLSKAIYVFGKIFLGKVSVSKRMIEHYASLVPLFQRNRLNKKDRLTAYVYIICYIQARYDRITNNLIQGFIYHVDKNHTNSKKHTANLLPKESGPVEDYETQLGQLLQIFTNKTIMKKDGPSIEKYAFSIMPKDTINSVSQKLLKRDKSRKQKEQIMIWEYHKTQYHASAINLRPLFSSIDFENIGELSELFKAYRFWNKLVKNNKSLLDYMPSQVPMNHIRPKYLRDCFKEKIKIKNKIKTRINSHQYEFYLYRSIRENIRNRKVSVNSSVDYRSFEAEVNTPNNWDKKGEEYLQRLNNKTLLQPIDDILNELEAILEPLIERTNRRVLNGENEHIKIKRFNDGRVRWTLPYPKNNSEIDNPFYNKLEVRTISEIFDFVEQKCNFMRAFTHITPSGGRKTQDYLAIKGVILANGTMQGTTQFAKRSNLDYKRLKMAEENNIRLSTLRGASDIIIDKMISLPIFDEHLIIGNLHGSVDGKKKKSRRKLLKARYSSKYFGTDIGFVLMSMGVGHVPFATKIIGANEHEGHFVFPMLIHNNNIIDPDIISTDTAGTNNINDLLYYLLGKIHAPCYRSFVNQADKICGFKPLSHYQDLFIKPDSRVNKKNIRKIWPEVLPVLYGLLSHDTKQENIIRQLASHDYKSEIKDALWEMNKILKSIHALKYIDDAQYQRDIRKALNRGEAYHQLLDKIAEVGGGDFRGMSELEVEIWNECMRFIALLIIYYNMSLLSKLLIMSQDKGDEEAIKYLRTVSPVASQHLNIGGLYEFSEDRAEIDIDHVVVLMEKILLETLQKATKGNMTDIT